METYTRQSGVQIIVSLEPQGTVMLTVSTKLILSFTDQTFLRNTRVSIYKVDFPPESNSQSKYKPKIEHLNLVILCHLPKLNKLLLAAISERGLQRLCLTVNY